MIRRPIGGLKLRRGAGQYGPDLMLPAPLQFIVAMFAYALNARMARKMPVAPRRTAPLLQPRGRMRRSDSFPDTTGLTYGGSGGAAEDGAAAAAAPATAEGALESSAKAGWKT
jgi:hypothetical protein